MHMSSRSCCAALVVVVLTLSLPAAAQEAAPSKEQRARQLLVLMRTGDMGLQIIDNMIDAMKAAMPQAGEEFWPAFRKKAKDTDFVDMLVPVYAKNLESADIDELIRFYSSPAGQRFLDRQPVIMQESMAIGQKWGEQLATQAIQELQKTQTEQ